MENVFEEAVADNGAAVDESSTLGSEYDLDFTPEDDEASAEATFDEGEDEGGESFASESFAENPTNQAFAQMRTQNRQYAEKFNELDAIAKAAGLKDVDDLIAKSKEAQIKQDAKEQGIPEAVDDSVGVELEVETLQW